MSITVLASTYSLCQQLAAASTSRFWQTYCTCTYSLYQQLEASSCLCLQSFPAIYSPGLHLLILVDSSRHLFHLQPLPAPVWSLRQRPAAYISYFKYKQTGATWISTYGHCPPPPLEDSGSCNSNLHLVFFSNLHSRLYLKILTKGCSPNLHLQTLPATCSRRHYQHILSDSLQLTQKPDPDLACSLHQHFKIAEGCSLNLHLQPLPLSCSLRLSPRDSLKHHEDAEVRHTF